MTNEVKVRIDLNARAVEVAGPEAFVREMLQRYEKVIQMQRQDAGSPGRSGRRRNQPKQSERQPAAAKPARGGVPADAELKEELQAHVSELKDFFAQRVIKSQTQEAAVAAGFLAKELGRETINDGQYVTVLRILGRRLPKKPRQALIDAKNKNGYLFDDGDSFGLTAKGTNFVDHDSVKEEAHE